MQTWIWVIKRDRVRIYIPVELNVWLGHHHMLWSRDAEVVIVFVIRMAHSSINMIQLRIGRQMPNEQAPVLLLVLPLICRQWKAQPWTLRTFIHARECNELAGKIGAAWYMNDQTFYIRPYSVDRDSSSARYYAPLLRILELRHRQSCMCSSSTRIVQSSNLRHKSVERRPHPESHVSWLSPVVVVHAAPTGSMMQCPCWLGTDTRHWSSLSFGRRPSPDAHARAPGLSRPRCDNRQIEHQATPHISWCLFKKREREGIRFHQIRKFTIVTSI
jgi:hypothetical protein